MWSRGCRGSTHVHNDSNHHVGQTFARDIIASYHKHDCSTTVQCMSFKFQSRLLVVVPSTHNCSSFRLLSEIMA